MIPTRPTYVVVVTIIARIVSRDEGRDHTQGKLNRELTAEMELVPTRRVREDSHWALPEETPVVRLHRSLLFRRHAP